MGGKNLIGVPDFADSFRPAGYHGVRTHTQRRNVLFTAEPATGTALEDAVERMLRERFGIADAGRERGVDGGASYCSAET